MIFGYLYRFIKRLLVLVPGVWAATFGARQVFPVFDERIPTWVAIIVTYVVVAYIIIPTLFRFIRYLFPPKHVPLYCVTPDGFACDPVNVGIVGTKAQLKRSMKKAGWYQADSKTIKSGLRIAASVMFKKPYLNAPFSTLFLFGRGQDIGFQKPVGNSPSKRHHVRFWAASHTTDPHHLEHISFWDRFFQSNLETGRVLWVGAASKDVGMGVIRHNAQITHNIHHDTNAERDKIADELKKSGQVQKIKTVTIGSPYKVSNRVIRRYMLSDGKMKLIELS
ncbi:MAG: LssY C-terminal domain-containing protein [Patescibacteria group bacterium]